MEEVGSREKRRSYGRARGQKAKESREALVLELTIIEYRRQLDFGERPPRDLVDGLGRCQRCDRDLPLDELEVDHVDGRNWEMTRLGRWTRVARMWQELRDGVRLRALCRFCNALGGGRRYGGSR